MGACRTACCSKSSPGAARAPWCAPSTLQGLFAAGSFLYRSEQGRTPEIKLITILSILQVLLTVAQWIIIIQAILSWLISFNVINTHNDTVRAIWTTLDRITEPFYRPIRRIMPDFGALDLSPLVVLLIIWCIQIAIGRLALWWVGAGAL
jgi:YggT family protein